VSHDVADSLVLCTNHELQDTAVIGVHPNKRFHQHHVPSDEGTTEKKRVAPNASLNFSSAIASFHVDHSDDAIDSRLKKT